MESSTFLLILLKKKTSAAPAAVTNHVKRVAKKALHTGEKDINESNIS